MSSNYSYLLCPVQRICKYPLQIEALAKICEDDSTKATVANLATRFKGLLDEINEEKKSNEVFLEIDTWQNKVRPTFFSENEPNLRSTNGQALLSSTLRPNWYFTPKAFCINQQYENPSCFTFSTTSSFSALERGMAGSSSKIAST